MDCITLTDFRTSLYACFHAAGDTLLNLVDALATETAAKSLPELSLSAFFPRKGGSVYQGLQNARIDRPALRRLATNRVLSRPTPTPPPKRGCGAPKKDGVVFARLSPPGEETSR